MKERPILFSSPMVRAILDGTKAQTRRLVKPQPWASCLLEEGHGGESPFVYSALDGAGPGYDVEESRTPCICPYGEPGDRLYVRERWAPVDQLADGIEREEPVCIGYFADHSARRRYATNGGSYSEPLDTDLWNWEHESVRWRPSIHMPRWASRITLEVTGVRVERLCDISEADAKAEGCPCYVCGAPLDGHSESDCHCFHRMATASDYRDLWEQINGAGSWEANPWVWVVEFKRIEQEAAR